LFERFAQADLWHVYADVPAQLEAWHRRGLKLAVVSNFDSRLPGLLEALGLARWLNAVVVSSAAGAAKPDPLPFQQALARLNLGAAEVWHVGDSPEDGAGARAAGIHWVQVKRP
jgi:putative hydrolase of the HAD superfamily